MCSFFNIRSSSPRASLPRTSLTPKLLSLLSLPLLHQNFDLNQPQTRQLDACTKAVETLNVRIYTHGAIVPEVLAKLEEMVAAMRGNNLKGAKMVLKSMSRGAYWKTEKTWLKSLKYLFDLLEKMAPK